MADLFDKAWYVILGAASVFVLWQFWTGKAPRRNFLAEWISRKEQPGAYWTLIAMQIVAIAFFLLAAGGDS